MVEIARRIGSLAGGLERVEEHKVAAPSDECTWIEREAGGWVVRTQTGQVAANIDDLRSIDGLEKLIRFIQEQEKSNSK